MSRSPDRSDGPSRPIELLWLEPKHLGRVRQRPAWRDILDEARSAPPDEGVPALLHQDVPPHDGRDALLILARGEAIDADGVAAALSAAVRDDGRFAPPLVLVAGDLRLPFGEIDVLKAAVTTATPFTGGDEPLKAAVASAKEFLAIPDLSPAPAVIEAMTSRIYDAFVRVKRAVPPGYLEAQVDRALLEQRRYQKRIFRGEPHLRALLQTNGDKGAMLTYLPAAVADRLPLQHVFGVRLLAMAHLSVDQYETCTSALETVALARELPPRRG